MTPTRLAKAGTIVLFVAVWAVGAVLLWRTKVPDDLDVSGLDPHDYFSARQLERTADYARVSRLIWGGGTLTQLVVLVVLVLFARRIAGGFDLGKVGTGVMVGTFATLTLWAAGLPFGFLDLWWNRRHDLTEQTYFAWLLEQWPSLLAQVVGLTILLTFLMLLAASLRRWWWVAAAPILVAVGIGLAFLVSWLSTIGTHPIRSPEIAQDVRDLARRAHVANTEVRVEKMSDQTHLMNAETVGPAQATAVIFWDTVFDGRLSRRGIDFIAAHEFGHVARKHIWKGVGWSAIFTLPLLFVLAEATRRRGGMHLPEVVPFALLVLAVLSLVSLPVENVISRRYEAEADWMALRATHDPKAGREIFRKFATTDLEQPRPPLWDYVMLENHPTLVQRIAMVNAWEKRKG